MAASGFEKNGNLTVAFNGTAFDTPSLLALARALIPVVREAGKVQLDYYHNGVAVMDKADGSPVTLADQECEKMISAHLAEAAPGIPVVGEESTAAGAVPDISKGTFFLVDPLDGTKEFIGHNGDFTVNIALLVDSQPVMGIIFAPLSGRLYIGANDEAYEVDAAGNEKRLLVRAVPEAGLTVLEGKRPGDAEKTAALLKDEKIAATLERSSSMKFCAIAAAEADIYPRLGGTSEWDTAAGDAILRAAGGTIITLDGKPLQYGKTADHFHNPDFIALGDRAANPLKSPSPPQPPKP